MKLYSPQSDTFSVAIVNKTRLKALIKENYRQNYLKSIKLISFLIKPKSSQLTIKILDQPFKTSKLEKVISLEKK